MSPVGALEVRSLKQKASQLFQGVPPTGAPEFLEWRAKCIGAKITLLNALKRANREGLELGLWLNRAEYEVLESNAEQEIEEFKREEVIISRNSRYLVDDISDFNVLAKAAYINLILTMFEKASTEGQRLNKNKKPNLANFKRNVWEYLGARRVDEEQKEKQKFCHVLGVWRHETSVKLAHIIPQSFHSISQKSGE
jgi:hypothetical protein